MTRSNDLLTDAELIEFTDYQKLSKNGKYWTVAVFRTFPTWKVARRLPGHISTLY